jgi:hypothetical protein
MERKYHYIFMLFAATAFVLAVVTYFVGFSRTTEFAFLVEPTELIFPDSETGIHEICIEFHNTSKLPLRIIGLQEG